MLTGYSTPLVDGTPGDARVELDRGPQRAGHRLVLRLGDVVPVAAAVHAHVQRDRGVVGERLEDVPGQRGGVVRADRGRRTVRLVVHEVGPAGQVDRGLHQRLVHRDQRVAEPAGAGLVAGGLRERLAERDRGVLDGVVRVDVQVAVDLRR